MANDMVVLKSFFPTGTAEGELSFLQEAFVVPADYSSIIEPPMGSPRLLVGKKGSGKSAIIQVLQSKCIELGVPVALLRPDDISVDVDDARDMGTLKRHALGALLGAVSAKLGESLRGLLNADDAKLFDQAVQKGLKSPDAVQRALRMLLPFGKAATGIDFGQLLAKADTTSAGILRALQENSRKSGRLFFLLFDDTDQLAAPEDRDHLNRIWAYLLAARQLASDLPNVRCVVTLRSEVWVRLQSERGGQRDQVDHFRPLVVDYNPTEEAIQLILERRLVLAHRALGSRFHSPYDRFFDGAAVQLPHSDEERSWADFIVKSARERPRDVVQFVNALAQNAAERNEPRISSATIERCMPRYSDERASDLALELERDCPQLLEVIDTFAKIPFRSEAERVRKHLEGLPSAFSITVRGVNLQPGSQAHIFLLWGLLYEGGFLNPRWPDARNPKNFRHGSFRLDPELVSPARWNEMGKAEWEIHPAYRQRLQKRREDDAARVGASPKRKD